jgi:hypothetical protein
MSSRTKRARLLLPGVILTLVAGGCIEREGRPVNPCTQVTVAQTIQVNNVDKVDLLFMVDNSNSMTEEQASLAAEFPDMIQILTSGDFNLDDDNDDEDDFEPVRDLNVGIITSDMGVLGAPGVPTCGRADFGDDGVLRTQGRTDIAGCAATYPGILNFRAGSGVTPTAFARDVACVANVGIGGCGFEQQLEAVLKAVSPRAATNWTAPGFVAVGTPGAPRGLERPFFRMSEPHGDGLNNGFARPDSVLALIPVTDEEDCSAFDGELFNPMSAVYGATDLNLRCFVHGDQAQHPVERYTNGFLQLRDRPGLLIYAPITGVPVDLAQQPGQPINWDALVSNNPDLRDDRMEERVDPTMMNRLTPSCNVPGRGVAFPPVRIVRVAQQLEAAGAGVTVQSICQESFRGALTEIIRQIKSALGAACLPRALNVNADGSVDCDVVILQPPGQACSEAAGLTPKLDDTGTPIVEGDRALCVMRQLVPSADDRGGRRDPTGTGWFYDNYTATGEENCSRSGSTYQRIAFAGTQPVSGAEVRLECFLAVQGGGGTDIAIGTFCDPAQAPGSAGNLCSSAQNPERTGALSCDPVGRTCGVPCMNDAECRSAGLIGFVCDTRPLSEVDPARFSGNDAAYNYCVNPTCS